jgi:cation diffusion facilitator family transporter
MHTQRIEIWQHNHSFNVEKRDNENRTSIVVIITFITMIAEILVGWITNSMALYADGWHMGTHAFAMGVSVLAYILARKYSKDEKFTFGTWKIEILGAFSSALVLGIVGVIMIFTSVERIISPLAIHYDQALFVTIIGLIVNVICAMILNTKHGGHSHPSYHQDAHGHSNNHGDHESPHDDHAHPHDHGDHESPHDHDHSMHHGNDDLNFRSAYLHVFADAITSVLAIIALTGAKYFHFNWLDPFMGIVGAALILRWSVSLLKDTSSILLDRQINIPLANTIKEKMESDGDTRISDLHLWKVEQSRYACIIALVTAKNYQIDDFKKRLWGFHELVHVTIEVNPCQNNIP